MNTEQRREAEESAEMRIAQRKAYANGTACDLDDDETKTKAQHTPGPWVHQCGMTGHATVMGDNGRVSLCELYQEGETRIANAHLIAAAPAMYEALEKSLAILMQDSETMGQVNARQRRDAKRLIRAALAAARGE